MDTFGCEHIQNYMYALPNQIQSHVRLTKNKPFLSKKYIDKQRQLVISTPI